MGIITREAGILKIKRSGCNPVLRKNLLWDKIKELGGENPS